MKYSIIIFLLFVAAKCIATPTNLRLGTSSLAQLMQHGEDDANDYTINGANMGRSTISALTESDEIANNTISKRAIKHYQLYRSVKLQTIDLSGSPSMQSFMNSAKTDNTGLFFTVDSLLHNAEADSNAIASAKYLNNAITVKNKVDKTHKAFNNLYVFYLAQNRTLKPNEVLDLESIALLCPPIYGNAVYQARAVLFGLKKQSYMSACEKVSPLASSKRIAQQNIIVNELVVYPNPATNELFINAGDYINVSIKLYNIIGELVLDKTITNTESINISSLANGVYTYKIYSNGNELKTDKLIIIK